MKNILETILDWVEWLVFAGWYDGGDMGDGILVSLISGGIALVIYLVYPLLASLF